MSNLKRTPISTCSILKLCGALIVIPIMQEMLACMIIIGKISEENLTSLTMRKNSVHNGKLRTSFKPMLMVAKMNTDVSFLMDGKNKNIIP
jgi:hypothetical protein